jgi:ACS family hexuronate transporter-like MFS transporter
MKQKIGNYRWTVVALLFFATTINYLDRQVIGLLKPTLEKTFSWSEADYGNIVMAFSTAYALGLLFFGRLVDWIGTKTGYAISIIAWSLAAVGHAFARSTFGFGVARAALGLGESGNFPVAIKAVTEWFPQKERALATGIFNSGANIGAVAAPVMVPWILGIWDWQAAFLATGAIGFIWLIFWQIYYEVPARQAKLSGPEFEYIHSGEAETPENEKPVKWLDLFRIRQTWAFFFGKFLTDPIWWFFLFWLPSYFSTTFQINLKKPSLELAFIYTATSIGSIGGGYLSGYFMRMGWTAFRARKMAMLIFACCAVPVFFAQYATNVWTAIGLISLAAAAHQAWSANIYTTASDVFPKKTVSSIIGIGGMAGATGGIIFPFIVGHLLDYYKTAGNINLGYNLLFSICSCMYLLAWGVMHFLNRGLKDKSQI